MPILKNYIEGTQLNQLRYSSYNSGRGPIIQKKIPTGISERGNEFTQAGKRADDLARIAALMTRPEGLRYLSNEKGLSQVRIKGQAQSEGKQTLLGRLVGGTLNTVKVLGSTLLQVPLNGTGTHFVKGFGERAGYLERSYAGEIKNGGSVGDERDLGRKIGSKQTITDLGLAPNSSLTDTVTQNSSDNEFQPGKSNPNDPERLENRVHLGNISGRTPEQRSRKNIYIKDVKEELVDRKNLLGPTRQAGIQGNDLNGNPGNARDLVKFRFEIINPEDVLKNQNRDLQSENPINPVSLYFRAFIDDFSDSYSSEWNEFQYLGRGEKFFNYMGFDRNINVSFKSAAMTRHELKPMYQKLNYLSSALAPTYGNNGFMRGTLVKLTLGSYFYQLPGFISSLEYSWNNTYPFEIAMGSPEVGSGDIEADKDVQELPMVLDASLTFRPIHTFTPQTGLYHYTTNPTSIEYKKGVLKEPFFKQGQPIGENE